ncbi:LPXTG cell wall anchor domain-containing protein [Streptomyces sp. NPDC006368]|uniref:LPXTG cell wall anchor domain-containing protein n=1 Tax=Streptomyces sp. NPDC006368 TaxID=3156760 RepID=UPI0033ACF555
MNLRRAMAVAAATAVIAPAAFLAAPAAYATEDNTTGTTSSGTTGDQNTTTPDTDAGADTADDTTTPDTTTPDTADDTKPGADTKPADDTVKPGTDTKPAEDTAKEGDKPAKDTAKEGDKPAKAEDQEPAEGEGAEECPTNEDGIDLDNKLELGLKGLPGKITAGSGWHEFTLRATNSSDKALGTVQWALFVDNYSESDKEKDWLSEYAKIQFKNEHGKWESMADLVGNGAYFGETNLGAKAYVDLELRLNITAKAPAGEGYALGLGAYLDADKNCYHAAYSDWTFEVLKAGSGNEEPGEAKPGKGEKPDSNDGGTKPQGEAKPIPVTGNLAETGSSSMLPTIGIAGGIAIVAGAGVVFALKRRNSGATA